MVTCSGKRVLLPGEAGTRSATGELLLEMCGTYNLEQVVDKPTCGNKILDLFFTTNSTLIGSVEVMPALGDHGCVKIQTLVFTRLARPIKRKIFLYSKGNFSDMKKELLDFSSVYISQFNRRSLQENWDILKNKLSTLMEECIPTKMSSSRYNLPWFTSNLKKLNRKGHRLFFYCSLVGLKLEFANSVWYPYLQKDKHRLDIVRRSTARICYNNYSREPGVVINMLSKLEWPSLDGRRTLSRMSMFHRVVYGSVDIERESYLVPMTRTSRNGNSKRFLRPHTNCNQHANSFFPWGIRLWNELPGSITDIEDLENFKVELINLMTEQDLWF